MNIIDDNIILSLSGILDTINKELAKSRSDKYHFSLEQLLIHHAPDEVFDILLKYSGTFSYLATNRNGKNIVLLIDQYMNKIYQYYDEILFLDHSKFDKYVSYARGDTTGKSTYEMDDLKMQLDQISNSIALLNEAVRLWYDVYRNRTIVAEFNNCRYLYYKIKEGQLAHLLGVTWDSLKNNGQLKYMGIVIPDEELSDEQKFDILLKIVELYNKGNMLDYEHDRLKQMILQAKENYKFKVAEIDQYFDLSDKTKKPLLLYPKINVRAKALIDFRPLERLAYLLDLKEGIKVISKDPSDVKNSVLFSKNNYSETNNWTDIVSTFDKANNRDYMRSILIQTADQNRNLIETMGKECQANEESVNDYITSRTAIVDDDSSIEKWHVFSDEEKRNFLADVLSDFYGKDKGGKNR